MASNPTLVAPYVPGAAVSGLCRLSFRIQAAADGTAPDFVLPAGACTNIVRINEGRYSVVIPNYKKLPVLLTGVGGILGSQVVGADAKLVQIVSYTPSTGVLEFATLSAAATPALADPTADEWIMLDLVFGQESANDYAAGALSA